MSDPRVSVVIPHYERPGLLREAVASALASSEQRLEVIVVDDGSSNSDWRAARSLAGDRVRVFQREDGLKGPSRCRNLGVAAARGEWVVFLDSDDLLAPWCLEQRLAAAGRFADADLIVFPVLLFRDEPGDLGVLWNVMDDGREAVGRFARSDPPWHTSSPLWRRSALLELGGFNEAVRYGDDTDLHLRALISDRPVRLCPDALPDAFVRRSEAPRITNTMDASLIESRRIRLREGTRYLESRVPGSRHLCVWEGQYFVEGEFLLFNTPAAGPLRRVLDDWEEAFSPGRFRRWVVRGYFRLALATRDRVYLLLRLGRRMAMILLPLDFFPAGGSLHSTPAEAAVMAEVRRRLRAGRASAQL